MCAAHTKEMGSQMIQCVLRITGGSLKPNTKFRNSCGEHSRVASGISRCQLEAQVRFSLLVFFHLFVFSSHFVIFFLMCVCTSSCNENNPHRGGPPVRRVLYVCPFAPCNSPKRHCPVEQVCFGEARIYLWPVLDPLFTGLFFMSSSGDLS